MALQVSTGFKQLILGPHAFEDIFAGGAIKVFTGPQPATADAPEQGTFLGMVTLNGGPWLGNVLQNGLSFLRGGPFVTNFPGDHWLLVPQVPGTASWWRLVASPDDDGDLSYERPRIDGLVGVVGGTDEMQLPDPVLEMGSAVQVQSFLYTIPPIVGI